MKSVQGYQANDNKRLKIIALYALRMTQCQVKSWNNMDSPLEQTVFGILLRIIREKTEAAAVSFPSANIISYLATSLLGVGMCSEMTAASLFETLEFVESNRCFAINLISENRGGKRQTHMFSVIGSLPKIIGLRPDQFACTPGSEHCVVVDPLINYTGPLSKYYDDNKAYFTDINNPPCDSIVTLKGVSASDISTIRRRSRECALKAIPIIISSLQRFPIPGLRQSSIYLRLEETMNKITFVDSINDVIRACGNKTKRHLTSVGPSLTRDLNVSR